MSEKSEKETKEKSVYELLSASLPEEAIERTSKEITRKGYDTAGYQYQYVVERLNEVIGIGKWSFSYQIIKEISNTWGKENRNFFDIIVEITISIDSTDITQSHTCVGGHRAESYADALKGAITNGFKKTAAFFGIGQDAYKGIIDEDYRPIPTPSNQTTQQTNQQNTLQSQLKEKLTNYCKKNSKNENVVLKELTEFETTDKKTGEVKKIWMKDIFKASDKWCKSTIDKLAKLDKSNDTDNTNNYKFLQTMEEQKKRIGEMMYYKALKDAGYNHANEIIERQEQLQIFAALKNIKDLKKGCTEDSNTCEHSYFQDGQAGCKYDDTMCEFKPEEIF